MTKNREADENKGDNMFRAFGGTKNMEQEKRGNKRMFQKDLSAGNNAEKNFQAFAGQISDINILSPVRTDKEHVEGKDIMSIGITKKGHQLIRTEVKAVLNNTFITRDNDNLEPSGTLPFELWSNAWNEKGKLKSRKKWTIGWLPAMMNPQIYNGYNADKEKDITVEVPDQLAFMLCDDNQGKKPYACILFPSFEKLKTRLKMIAKTQEAPFNLERLSSPMDRFLWNDRRRNVPFNVWQVPLDLLVDLARITIFSDVPILIDQQSKKCPIRIQNARKDYLIAHGLNIINRVEEYKKAQAAERAYKRDLGLPEDAPVPIMPYFDSDKLPPSVKRLDNLSDWFGEYIGKECLIIQPRIKTRQ